MVKYYGPGEGTIEHGGGNWLARYDEKTGEVHLIQSNGQVLTPPRLLRSGPADIELSLRTGHWVEVEPDRDLPAGEGDHW